MLLLQIGRVYFTFAHPVPHQMERFFPGGVMVFDAEKKILYASVTFCELP